MDTITQVGLVLFTMYLPVFLMLLLLAVKRHKGYSFRSLWPSNLGDTRVPSNTIFNVFFFIYGFLGIFFAYSLSRILPNLMTAKISAFFLYLGSFSTILTSLVPMNKNLKIHHTFSNTVFISVTASSLFLIRSLFVLDIFPKYILVFNVLIILMSLITFIAFRQLVTKMGKIPETLFAMRKNEKSFLIRNVTLWEWVLIFLVILWNFALSVIMVQN